MHAYVRERERERERKGVRESFHLCMNSNHSAGEGRLGGGWESVYVAGGGRENFGGGGYVMRSDTSGEESQ